MTLVSQTDKNKSNGDVLELKKKAYKKVIDLCAQGAIFFQISNGFWMERYSHILIWCGRIFIKGRTCNRKCRKECSFNNEMI